MLSIADKADSIAGMFALGLIPSGSKDPFALRRQANGIVKTIAEHKLPLQLAEMMVDAREQYRGLAAEKKFANGDYEGSVRAFFHERLEFYLKEARGHAYDVVNAVLAANADDVVDALARAEALSEVADLPDFAQNCCGEQEGPEHTKTSSEKREPVGGSSLSTWGGSRRVEDAISAKMENMMPRVEKDRIERD